MYTLLWKKIDSSCRKSLPVSFTGNILILKTNCEGAFGAPPQFFICNSRVGPSTSARAYLETMANTYRKRHSCS